MTEAVLVAPPHGLHPATTEEGRAFLQSRLALLGQIGFGLGIFFFVFSHGLHMLLRPGGIELYLPIDRSSLWHLAGTSISLAMWLLMRRGRSFRWSALVALDAAAMLLALAAYGAMVASGLLRPQHEYGLALDVARTDLLMLLITVVLLTLHAIVVPCTARHSLLVSAAGSLPAHALSFWLFSSFPVGEPPISPAVGVTGTSLWCVTVILIATVTSRVIYGLRAQVHAAQRLGQYVLEEQIGEGGMGTVFRASHVLLRRPTALKLLRPERAGAATLARFEREVRLTSRLTHPNTIVVFDYGKTPGGLFYYAMEYLEGIDLERLVARHGAQPPARVAHVLEQACGSLAEAHAAGLVHRDIKPSNLMLCERGGVPDVVKVLDFGLAKEIVDGDASLTGGDTVIGTPLYLAPEAIRDPHGVDARADLYCLGAVGYTMLTGAPPFNAASVIDVCAAHLHQAPAPPSARAPWPIPPRLEALILRCLAKDPDDRPASAAALREELLDCGVRPWSEREARAWWAEHRGDTPPPSPATHLTITVDMLGRSPRLGAGAS
jgi:serine/threonine-protein kinase